MCGIVGYVQNQIVDTDTDNRYRNALADLLFIDTLRGMDSTGVAMIPRDMAKPHFVLKKAVPGYTFIDMDEYKNVWAMQNNPMVVIGHNRAATHGSVSDENAHPFVADHITLVHNGTIRNQWMLKSGVQSQVDSCHIAHAIAKHGAKAVLPELDGAAVLVWYDKTENSMNIARTRDRTLRWIFDEHGTCWYASERDMLWSVLARNGIEAKSEFFSADEFSWYNWKLSTQHISTLTEGGMGTLVKEKFPEYVPMWKQNQLKYEAEQRAKREAGESTMGEFRAGVQGTTRGWTSKTTTAPATVTDITTYKREEPKSKAKIAKANRRLKEFTLQVGDEITITRSQMVRNPKDKHLVDIFGVWAEKGVRVVLPDVPISMWDRQTSGKYQVLVYNLKMEHIPSRGKHSPLIFAKLKPYQMRDLVQGPNGKLIPKDEYVALAAGGCAWCPGTPHVNDHETTEWVNGKPLCHVCSTNFSGASSRMLN